MSNNCSINVHFIKNLFSVISTELSKDVAWQSVALKCFVLLGTLALTGAIYFSAISLSAGIMTTGFIFLIVKIALTHLVKKPDNENKPLEREPKDRANTEQNNPPMPETDQLKRIVVFNSETLGPFKVLPQELFNLVVLRLNGPQVWQNLYSINQAFLVKMGAFAQELRRNGFIQLNKIPYYPYNFSDLHKAKSFSRATFGKYEILLDYKNEELIANLNIRVAKNGTDAERQEAIEWLKDQSRAECLSPCNLDLKKLLMINFALGSIYSSSDPELSTLYYERGWTLLRNQQQPPVEVVMFFYGKDLGPKSANETSVYFNKLLDENIATFEKFGFDRVSVRSGRSGRSGRDSSQLYSYDSYCRYLLNVVDGEVLPPYYEAKRESIKTSLLGKIRMDDPKDLFKPIISYKFNVILKSCVIEAVVTVRNSTIITVTGNQSIVQNSVLSRYLDHSLDDSSGEFTLTIPSGKFEEFREILLNTPN